jgi:cell division septal protein FtsQ
MKIFSTHRRKLEPNRRFGGRDFKNKIKSAANYKRAFNPNPTKWYEGLSGWFSGNFVMWRTVGVVVVFLLFYFMVFSSRLAVVNVEVKGNQDLSSEQVTQGVRSIGDSRLFFIKKNNYFFMSQGRVNAALTKLIPEIKEVHTNRSWPNKISVEVVERNPGFVIESNKSYFLVDDEGTVVKQVESPDKLLVAQDQLVENYAQGEALNTKLAPFVISMAKQWPGKVNAPIALVKFPGKASTDVEFATTGGWSVLFDTGRSVASQLNNLSLILNKQISAKDQTKLAYIDLRLVKWAYYCFKESPCQSKPSPDQEGTADAKE